MSVSSIDERTRRAPHRWRGDRVAVHDTAELGIVERCVGKSTASRRGSGRSGSRPSRHRVERHRVVDREMDRSASRRSAARCAALSAAAEVAGERANVRAAAAGDAHRKSIPVAADRGLPTHGP